MPPRHLLRSLALVAAAAVVPPALADDAASSASPPEFRDVSVHDPDIVLSDDGFYIFGSHLAVARSDDLVAWESVADGVRDDNPVIPNVTREMGEALAWGESQTFWAGCVTRLDDGRWAFYYSVCRGDSPRAALGLAFADDVAGPYRDAGILLKSGMWDQPSEDGAIYDATRHPNAIDPHVFRDAEGDLWMTYGSYSGGIFMLRLNAETGRPLPGQGYGKKVAGGNHSRIEAPYVLYEPEQGYYYLFLSYGGLASDGGYQVRVARATHPAGPYLDPQGNDLIDARGQDGTFFDDESIAPFGAVLLANFQVQPATPDGEAWGYVSPGHNSAYHDPETGDSFLVFHSRFPGRGEFHQVRVHRLLFTDDGWPLVAPHRYDGSPLEADAKSPEQAAGRFEIVVHESDISADVPASATVTLETNGTVTGAHAGSWEVQDKSITITLDDVTYDGILLEQWDPTRQADVITFTGLSPQGTSVWGIGHGASDAG